MSKLHVAERLAILDARPRRCGSGHACLVCPECGGVEFAPKEPAPQRVGAQARHSPRQNGGHRELTVCTSHFAAPSAAPALPTRFTRSSEIASIKACWARILGCLGVIFTGVLLFYGRLLWGHMPSNGDALTFQHPDKVFSRWCLIDGVLPSINPYILCGSPQLSNIATGSLYPLNILLIAGSETFGHNLFIFVHVALAGFAMFLLVRRVLGFSLATSCICGLSYCLGGCVWGTVDKGFLVSAWLIPLFFTCFCCLMKGRRVIWFVGSVVSLSVLFYSGNFIEACSAIMLAVCGLVLHHVPGTKGTVTKKKLLAAGAALAMLLLVVGNAALLSSPQIVPTFLASRISCRSEGVGLDAARHWSFPAPRLVEYFVPFAFGSRTDGGLYYGKMYMRDPHGAGDSPWFDSVFIGLPLLLAALLPLILNVRGLGARSRCEMDFVLPEGHGRMMLFLYSGIVFSLMLSMGRTFPLYSILYRFLPGFSFFRHPEKFLTWANILLILAGAHGLNLIESPKCEFRKIYAMTARWLIAPLCLGLFALGFWYILSPAGFGDFFHAHGSRWSGERVLMWQAGSILSSISCLVLIVALAKTLNHFPRKIMAWIAALTLVQLVSWSYLVRWTLPVSSFVNASAWEGELPAFDRSQWRIFAADSFRYPSAEPELTFFNSLSDNAPVLRKVRVPNGFSALMEQSYYDFFNFTAADPMALLSKTSVRYIAGPPPGLLQIPPGCRLMAAAKEFTIMENMSAKPRISLLQDPESLSDGNSGIRILKDSPGHLELEILGGRGTLVVRDWLSPGWHCYDDDGNELPLHPADGGFISTDITHNKNPRIITLKFHTPGFNTGLALASAGAALLAALSFTLPRPP